MHWTSNSRGVCVRTSCNFGIEKVLQDGRLTLTLTLFCFKLNQTMTNHFFFLIFIFKQVQRFKTSLLFKKDIVFKILIRWIEGANAYPCSGFEIGRALWPIVLRSWRGPATSSEQGPKWALKLLAHINTWCINDIRKKNLVLKNKSSQVSNTRAPNGPQNVWLISTPAHVSGIF